MVTYIVDAGRTESAFATEFGTMKVSEQIDTLDSPLVTTGAFAS